MLGRAFAGVEAVLREKGYSEVGHRARFLCGGRVRWEGKRSEPVDLRVCFWIPGGEWLAVPEAGNAVGYRTAVEVTPACPRVLTSFPLPR